MVFGLIVGVRGVRGVLGLFGRWLLGFGVLLAFSFFWVFFVFDFVGLRLAMFYACGSLVWEVLVVAVAWMGFCGFAFCGFGF